MSRASAAADDGGPTATQGRPGSRNRATTGLDLRLLVPAMIAWAAAASVLTVPALPVALGAGAAATLALVAVMVSRRPHREGRFWPRPHRRGPAKRRPARRAVAWVAHPLATFSLAALALVGVSVAAHSAVRAAGPVAELADGHAIVEVVGTVTSDPMVFSGPRQDRPGVRLRLSLHEVSGHGLRSQVATPVQVVADQSWSQVRWHERVRARGKLVPPQPGDDVSAVLRPMDPPTVVRQPGLVARAAEHLRAGLRDAATSLPADARGLLPALVVGDTSRTPPSLTEAMRATGMTHLAAVSGSNVAVVLAFAMGGASLCGVGRRWRPAVALAVLAGFVVLCRPEPSVVRAATMGAIGLIGLSRSRRSAGIPVLSAAIVVLLVADPWLARSFGFALSTLATLGLLLFTRSWGRAIGRRLPRRIRSLGPAIAIPIAAQAMCAPVVVLLQGSVSVVGVVANLLAAPMVAPATVSGVAAAVLAPLWPFGATVLCWLGALPALAIAWTARSCATVPGGTMPWPDGAPGAVLLAAVTVLAILSGRWWAHHVRLHPFVALGACALVVAASAPTSPITWPPPGWRFVACDVGQGDGLVLATTPGHAVLVDAGPDPALVDACLRRLDVSVLDSVVLSHYHADHVEGLPGAFHGREVREILASPVRDPPYEWKRVETWAGARGIPVRDVAQGDHLAWQGVTADVWWPARRIAAGSVPNNASVVLAVRAGPLDLLLMGDVEREAAHAILLELRRDPAMAAEAEAFDVVKAPHHGSANLDEDLMARVRAPVAVISVGKDNDYGHPSPKALEVLRRNGYAVYRTDQRGDVAVVVIDGRVGVTWRRR